MAEVDAVDGLGVRRLRLRLTELNLDKVRPYIDSLPFIGLISGPVEADGDLNDIATRGDIVFTDLAVPGRPTTSLSFNGRLQTGTGALVFDKVAIAQSDIDLRTVRNLAPAVLLDGRLYAVGTLNGPLTNATFTGTARHKDGERPESIVDGWLRLDSRETTDAGGGRRDACAAQLRGHPRHLPGRSCRRASLRGQVKLDGPVDRLFVDVDVQGELGEVKGSGTVTILPPRWGADSSEPRLQASRPAGADRARGPHEPGWTDRGHRRHRHTRCAGGFGAPGAGSRAYSEACTWTR